MPNCQHDCCRDCAGKHFTITIKDRNISEATCPFCMEPKGLADDDDLAANYFAKLDVLIKPIVDQDVHDLFQRKIRDRTLMKDPNFKWCYKVCFYLTFDQLFQISRAREFLLFHLVCDHSISRKLQNIYSKLRLLRGQILFNY